MIFITLVIFGTLLSYKCHDCMRTDNAAGLGNLGIGQRETTTPEEAGATSALNLMSLCRPS